MRDLPSVPEVTQAVPLRSPDELSVLTEPSPAITSEPNKLSSGTAKKIFSVFLAFFLLLFVGLLVGLFKTHSQLKRASEENENLRRILSDATVKSHIEELARQNEVFTRNFQNVKIRLESLPPSREGLLQPVSEFPAVELPPQ